MLQEFLNAITVPKCLTVLALSALGRDMPYIELSKNSNYDKTC
jgi:hypothetical protein